MASLHVGDIITLCTDQEGTDASFLATDVIGVCGATAERLVVASSPRHGQDLVPPPSFETRCLFRVGTTRTGASDGDIIYGQPIVLTHVLTDACLCATSPEDVELLPVVADNKRVRSGDSVDEAKVRRLPAGAVYYAEPRYKLRTEGDRVSPGDHILLQSARFPGAYLHLAAAAPKYAPQSYAETEVAVTLARSDGGSGEGPLANIAMPAAGLATLRPPPLAGVGMGASSDSRPLAGTAEGRAVVEGAGTLGMRGDHPSFAAGERDDDCVLLAKESGIAQMVSLSNAPARLGWVVHRYAAVSPSASRVAQTEESKGDGTMEAVICARCGRTSSLLRARHGGPPNA